ncbi:MAG TPA: type II toxin-antitoxin system prevent-host-death family antitoxin [Chloroflexia bacterium]|nr:type II toxin-antitoxin system prevent-host-death family antitoxin [Chloroflexia bacterium]
MKVMGVRDLKAHLSEALDAVAQGDVIEVTNHGRSIARIVPIERKLDPQEMAEALERMDRLSEEISKYATPGITVEQIINDIRS